VLFKFSLISAFKQDIIILFMFSPLVFKNLISICLKVKYIGQEIIRNIYSYLG